MINEMEVKSQVELIKSELSQFNGTEHYYRYSPLFPNFLLSEGVKFMAESCKAIWLLDLVASHQHNLVIRTHPKLKEGMQFWTLTVKDKKGRLKCEWDKGKTVLREEIAYTDFPLTSITIWIGKEYVDGQLCFIAFLPNEY